MILRGAPIAEVEQLAVETAGKARYGGELFPAETAAEPAGTTFLDYFQRNRDTGKPKGIIAIDLGGLS